MRPIDADALHEEISKWPESVMYKDWVQSAIANAPTIAQPPNDPLTLEELRGMDGEPVWVVEGTLSYHALMSGVFDAVIWLIARWGERGMRTEDYGKTWLAYRRKPEDGTT